MRRTERLLIVALVLAAIVPYLNALRDGFAFDDREIIVENSMVRSADTPASAFFEQPFYPGGLYRPLSFYSYWLDARVHGVTPFGFHLVNIALHALVTVLVFSLFRSMRLNTMVSFLGALFFAVHPIHTEAVTNVVGRAELLSAAAVLGALLCQERGTRENHRAWLAASAVLFVLGLLCKENAFVFVPLLLVTTWVRERQQFSQASLSLVRSGDLPLFVAIGAAYVAMRWAFLGAVGVADSVSWLDSPLASVDSATRIATAIVVLSDSLVQLLVPARLSADYSFNQVPLVQSANDPRLVLSLALLTLLAGLFWAWRHRAPALLGGALIFAAAFSVTSNILFPIGTIRAERLLYLPSVGFCLVLAVAAAFAMQRRKASTIAAVAAFVLVYSGRTWARNFDWHSDLALFTSTVESTPESAKAHHNLGAALAEIDRYEDASLSFREALQIYPDYDEAAFGIGHMYDQRGMMAAALHWYDECLRINPRHVKSYLNRGAIFYNSGHLAEAEASFNDGLRMVPDDPRLLTGIGFVRLAQGRSDEARTVLAQASQLAPDDPETQRALRLAAEYQPPAMKGS